MIDRSQSKLGIRCFWLAAFVVVVAGACSDSSGGDSDIGAPVVSETSITAAVSSSVPAASGTAVAPSTTPRTSPPTTDLQGRECDGGAFPRDPEFRFLICDVQYLRLDILAAGVPNDPDWISRASVAILGYDLGRDEAVAALEELKAELTVILEG